MPADRPDPRKPVRAQRPRARDHEDRAWGLRIKGWTQQAIADELGLTRQAIQKLLDRAERRVLEACSRRIGQLKARQDARLEHMICEAALGWERSQRPGRKRRRKTTVVKVGIDGQTVEQPGEEVTRETTGRDGNPAFLAEIRQLMADQRRLWRIGVPGAEETPDDDEPEDYAGYLAMFRGRSLAELTPEQRRVRLEFEAERARHDLKAAERRLALDGGHDDGRGQGQEPEPGEGDEDEAD